MRLPLIGALLLVVAVGAVVITSAADAADGSGRRTIVIGRSVEGRPIVAIHTGDFDAARTTLVVGCIHGNECAGVAVAEQLTDVRSPNELNLWLVPNLNPDGAAADTRGNGHGVDLNRNFPWRWQPLSGLYDSGPRPLSEPESTMAYRLILRIRPTISIWFHQHLDVVDESGGRLSVERRFAHLAAMRLVRLTREPGSAVGWQDHRFPSSTAFVVELPAGSLTPTASERLARAVLVTSLG
jgi:protein MpaA